MDSHAGRSKGQGGKEGCAAGRALTLFPSDAHERVVPPTKDTAPTTGGQISAQEYTSHPPHGSIPHHCFVGNPWRASLLSYLVTEHFVDGFQALKY